MCIVHPNNVGVIRFRCYKNEVLNSNGTTVYGKYLMPFCFRRSGAEQRGAERRGEGKI